VSFLHELACPLSEQQKQNVAFKLRNMMDEINKPLLDAVKYAHANSTMPFTKEQIWKNLFITTGKGNLAPVNASVNMIPEDIYKGWDIQAVLKYLYFGGQRVVEKTPKRYAEDQNCFFQLFGISYSYMPLRKDKDDPVGLFAGDYSRSLNQAINLRNSTHHITTSNTDEWTVVAIAGYVECLAILLRPLCGAVSWDQKGKEDAQKMLKRLWPEVCKEMGEVSYPMAGILEFLRIPDTEQAELEQMLSDAGFAVDNGTVSLCGDVDEMAYGLLYAWKVSKQIGKEYGQELLQECRKRIQQNLEKAAEHAVAETKDWKTMPRDALEALAGEGNVQAQYQLACRLEASADKRDSVLALSYYRSAANADHAPAQVWMGRACEDGICGQRRDWKEAAFWYQKAAMQNDAEGLYRLGVCYAFGRGVVQDKKQAANYYEMAQMKGSQEAQICAAALRLTEDGGDQEEALTVLRDLAEQGIPLAQAKLGECCLNGYGMQEDFQAGEAWVRKAAQAGDRTGQYWLGLCLREDYDPAGMAEQWLQKAAQQGHVGAQLECWAEDAQTARWLTEIAQQISGPEAEKAVAEIIERRIDGWERWAEPAAEKDAYVALRLAERYLDENIHRGQEYFELAAKIDSRVIWPLIELYRKGKTNVPVRDAKILDEDDGDCYYIFFENEGAVNPQRALYWLERKGNMGDPMACRQAAEYYLEGKAGKKDPERAMYWYRLSGERGYNRAYRIMAQHYLEGKHVQQSRQKAIECYLDGLNKAIAAGGGLEPEKQQAAVMRKIDPYLQPAMPVVVVQAACRHLEDMAKCNWELAMLRLGNCYLTRKGLEHGPQEGIRWLMRSFEEGEMDAGFILATIYWDGILVPQDRKYALHWLEKIAPDWDLVCKDAITHEMPQYQYLYSGVYSKGELGHYIGKNGGGWYLLAQCYDKVIGDQTKAFACFEKAWKEGYVAAKDELIRRYQQGIGVKRDPNMAQKLSAQTGEVQNSGGNSFWWKG